MAASEETCDGNPNFAIICSFISKFGDVCGVDVTIPCLQQMLEDTKHVDPVLQDLIILLMRRGKKRVTKERWERCLVKFCHEYSSLDAWELERFGFPKAKLSVKLEVLKRLLELQFDANAKFKAEVNKQDVKELRLLPLGRDIDGQAYWYQLDKDCNMRLYKESLTEDNLWQLLCTTTDDLRNLLDRLEKKYSCSTGEPYETKNDVKSPPRDDLPVPKRENEEMTSSLSESKPCTIIIKTEKKDIDSRQSTESVTDDKPAHFPSSRVGEMTSTTIEDDKGGFKLKLKFETHALKPGPSPGSETRPRNHDSGTNAVVPMEISPEQESDVESTAKTVVGSRSLEMEIDDPEPEFSKTKTEQNKIDDVEMPECEEKNLVEVFEHKDIPENEKSNSVGKDPSVHKAAISCATVPLPNDSASLVYKSSKIKLYEKWNSEKNRSAASEKTSEDTLAMSVEDLGSDASLNMKECEVSKQSDSDRKASSSNSDSALNLSKTDSKSGDSLSISSHCNVTETDSSSKLVSSQGEENVPAKCPTDLVFTNASVGSSLSRENKSSPEKPVDNVKRSNDAPIIHHDGNPASDFSHIQALQSMCEMNSMGGLKSGLQSTPVYYSVSGAKTGVSEESDVNDSKQSESSELASDAFLKSGVLLPSNLPDVRDCENQKMNKAIPCKIAKPEVSSVPSDSKPVDSNTISISCESKSHLEKSDHNFRSENSFADTHDKPQDAKVASCSVLDVSDLTKSGGDKENENISFCVSNSTAEKASKDSSLLTNSQESNVNSRFSDSIKASSTSVEGSECGKSNGKGFDNVPERTQEKSIKMSETEKSLIPTHKDVQEHSNIDGVLPREIDKDSVLKTDDIEKLSSKESLSHVDSVPSEGKACLADNLKKICISVPEPAKSDVNQVASVSSVKKCDSDKEKGICHDALSSAKKVDCDSEGKATTSKSGSPHKKTISSGESNLTLNSLSMKNCALSFDDSVKDEVEEKGSIKSGITSDAVIESKIIAPSSCEGDHLAVNHAPVNNLEDHLKNETKNYLESTKSQPSHLLLEKEKSKDLPSDLTLSSVTNNDEKDFKKPCSSGADGMKSDYSQNNLMVSEQILSEIVSNVASLCNDHCQQLLVENNSLESEKEANDLENMQNDNVDVKSVQSSKAIGNNNSTLSKELKSKGPCAILPDSKREDSDQYSHDEVSSAEKCHPNAQHGICKKMDNVALLNVSNPCLKSSSCESSHSNETNGLQPESCKPKHLAVKNLISLKNEGVEKSEKSLKSEDFQDETPTDETSEAVLKSTAEDSEILKNSIKKPLSSKANEIVMEDESGKIIKKDGSKSSETLSVEDAKSVKCEDDSLLNCRSEQNQNQAGVEVVKVGDTEDNKEFTKDSEEKSKSEDSEIEKNNHISSRNDEHEGKDNACFSDSKSSLTDSSKLIVKTDASVTGVSLSNGECGLEQIKADACKEENSECGTASKDFENGINKNLAVYYLRGNCCLESKMKHPLHARYLKQVVEEPKKKLLTELKFDFDDDEPLINYSNAAKILKEQIGLTSPNKVLAKGRPTKRGPRNRKKGGKGDFTIPEGFLEILGSADSSLSDKFDAGKRKQSYLKEDQGSQQSSENETNPRKRSRRIQEQHQKKMSELAVQMEKEQRRLELMAKKSKVKKNITPQKTPTKDAKISIVKGSPAKPAAKTPTKGARARNKIDVSLIEEETCMESKRTPRKMNNRSKNLTKMTLLYEDESKDSQFSTSRETERSKRRKRRRGGKKGSYKPWDVSSESTSSVEEITEEEEEEPEEILVFDVNEDEFACEEVDHDAEPVVVRRARTAKKIEGPTDEESVIDDKPCKKCGKLDKPEWILLCDKCDNGYHTHCLVPPLMIIPDGDWFCQPCEHMFLCQCLQEEIKKLDHALKQKEREILRKQRLAYVGISLDNALKPDKKEEEEEKEDEAESSESSKEKDRKEKSHKHKKEKECKPRKEVTSEDERNQKLFAKRSIRARRTVNYRFKEYDELIASALQEEIGEQYPAESEKVEGDEEKEEDESDANSDKPFSVSPKKKKRTRSFKNLDDFSEDDDSGDDYKGQSTDSEATPPVPSESEPDSHPSDAEWGVKKSKSKSRSRTRQKPKGRRKSRRGRGGTSEEESDWSEEELEDSDNQRPVTRRSAAQKTVSYREISSEEDEWGAKPKKPAKRRKEESSSEESESSFKKKTVKKKRIKKWGSSDSESEEKSGSSSEEESAEEESDESDDDRKKKERMRLKASTNKKVLSSEEDEESSTQDSEPKAKSKKVVSEETEESEEEEEEESGSEEESEEEEKSKKVTSKAKDASKKKPTRELKVVEKVPTEKTKPPESSVIKRTVSINEKSVIDSQELQPKVVLKKEVDGISESEMISSKELKKEVTKLVTAATLSEVSSPKNDQPEDPSGSSLSVKDTPNAATSYSPRPPMQYPSQTMPPLTPIPSSRIQYAYSERYGPPHPESAYYPPPSYPGSRMPHPSMQGRMPVDPGSMPSRYGPPPDMAAGPTGHMPMRPAPPRGTIMRPGPPGNMQMRPCPPNSIPMRPGMPMRHGSSSNMPLRPDLPRGMPMRPEYPGVIPMRPDHPSGMPLRHDHPSNMPMRPDHTSGMPMRPDHPSGMPMRPDHPSGMPMRPDHPSGMPMRPDHPSGMPMRPDHSKSRPMRPDHPANMQVRPDHPNAATIKSEHPSSLPVRPDHPSGMPMRPDHPSGMPMRSNHLSGMPMRPDHPSSMPMRPDHPSSMPIRPDHSSGMPMRPDHPSGMPMRPDHPSGMPMRPDHPSGMPLRPDHPSNMSVRPDHPMSMSMRPDHPSRMLMRHDHPGRMSLRPDHSSSMSMRHGPPTSMAMRHVPLSSMPVRSGPPVSMSSRSGSPGGMAMKPGPSPGNVPMRPSLPTSIISKRDPSSMQMKHGPLSNPQLQQDSFDDTQMKPSNLPAKSEPVSEDTPTRLSPPNTVFEQGKKEEKLSSVQSHPKTSKAPPTPSIQTKSDGTPSFKSTITEPFQENESDEEVPLERIPSSAAPPANPERPPSYEKDAEYRPAAKELSTFNYASSEEKSFPRSYSPMPPFQDYPDRPSPLKPSLVETYPNSSSPSKLTPLESYSRSNSPKGFISLDTYTEKKKKQHFFGHSSSEGEGSGRSSRPPSDSYQSGEIRFPPEPYTCPQSPNSYRSPPPSSQRDPGTPPRLYSQFPDAYAPPRSPEYYQNHQYYGNEERISRPSYQPNYASNEPPSFVSNPYVATPVPQPNGGFMIDTLLRARNHENEEDELTGVTDIVSYITQE